ncbi:Armadillo-like helical [Fusarium oxysporum f. sp. vasinfectum]|nr:Armadillo-like helical [Fusarium oxysporum f. sp. vasinfectum]
MSLEYTDPLAGLDSIEWSQLSHAYGPADDVPRLLKDLKSTDPEVYKTAFNKCWSNIYHQGSRYSASVEAVPFLYALIDSPATKDPESLLYLIVSLAIGHPDWAVPNGIDIQNWEKSIAEIESPAYCDRATQGFKAYEAVERGLSSIVRCLGEDSASMRANPAHALAFFPRHSAVSRVALLDLLSRETNNNVSVTIVLALAVLFARVEDDVEKQNLIDKIQEYYAASPIRKTSDDIVGWSCAVALFILGSKEDGLAETLQRVRVDKTYVDKLESTLDQDSWFPFSLLNLCDLAMSMLEN